jgi:hypothetical protein
MVTTTYRQRPLSLFLPPPNWASQVETTHTLAAGIEQALTGVENRRPLFSAMRHKIAASWLLEGLEALSWQEGSLLLHDQLLAVPLPFDTLPAARWDERLFDSGLNCAWNDEASFALFGRGEAVPAGFACAAPMLAGRLDKPPALKPVTPKACSFSLSLAESSPVDWAVNLRPAGAVSPDWPASLSANWREEPSDQLENLMETDELGAGREAALDGTEAPSWRGQNFSVLLGSRAEVAALLAFFAARKGPVQSWVVPWLFRPGDEPGNPAAPHQTRVRFGGDSIRLSWQTAQAAAADISLTQLPWEINLAENEQPEQAAEAFLYRFTAKPPGALIAWTYTDWESPLVRAGETYAPAKIEHGRIERGIELDDESVDINLWLDDQDNPVARVLRRLIDVPVHVEILACDPGNAAATPVTLYKGTLAEVAMQGRRLTATTTVLGGALEIKVPSFYFSKTCNHGFCRPGCNLSPADWTWAAAITTIDGNTVTVALTGDPQPALTLPDGFFNRGFVSFGAGDDYQLRVITLSVLDGGGSWTFTLKRPLRGAAAGLPLSVRPHCSGTVAECKLAGNFANFGGHPRMGGANLSLPTRETQPAGGKK